MSKKTTLFLTFTLVLFSVGYANENPVFINEVMASNATTIADEDGDYEDWIELFNAGQDTIQLEGFGLSDDYDNPFRWIFPKISIPPGEFLLVWASGKDCTDPALPLHTNFRISQDGEEVLLTHPDGTQLDKMPPLFIPTDISYGRKPDGEESWFFFSDPTPGGPNISEGFTEILEPPHFSETSGFFSQPFQLNLSHPDEEVVIIFTDNGSQPDINYLDTVFYQFKNQYIQDPGDPDGELKDNFFYAHLYQDPLEIKDRSNEPGRLTHISSTRSNEPTYFPESPVNKGTVIRAAAYREGALPSPVVTHTYFVSENDQLEYSLPILSISLDEDFLFDYFQGIYVAGVDFDEWRQNNPQSGSTGATPANYHRRGPEHEYPGHLQLFEPGESFPSFSQDMGFRIHGGWSRAHPMKSFRIYARNQYSHSHLEYPFFGTEGDSSFKRLIFRNSGNDFYRTMFRDAFIQRLVNHLNFDTQAYRPAVHFLNGEYWGLINIRERYDKHYLERVYGIDPENIDLLTGNAEIKEGCDEHYMATLQYMEDHDISEDEHFGFIKTRIDTENFTDYKIANIFARNTDWPGNNIDFWRLRTDTYEPNAEYGHDGRWRWLLFDTDFGFGHTGGEEAYNHNTLDFATAENSEHIANAPWATFLLRQLLKNEEFRHRFIIRFADLLNTAFLSERAKSLYAEMKSAVEPEVAEHIERWSIPANTGVWEGYTDVIPLFAKKRPAYQVQHILDYFELEGTIDVNLDVCNPLKGHIRINTIKVEPSTPGVSDNPYPWTGKYFKEISIKLEAIPVPGYRFSHWEGASISNSAVIELTPGENIQLKAHFERLTHHVMIHYWLFDTSLPNNTPLESIKPTYSISPGAILKYYSSLEGYPFDENHPLWRKASMERRNHPTPINYRPEGNQETPYEDSEMRGIQIREPFEDEDRKNTMIFYLPTNGYTDIVFGFAAINEEGAGSLLMDYSVSAENGEWITQGLEAPEVELSDSYRFFTFDFSEIPEVNKNAYFSIRLRFKGEEPLREDPERVTFNNITLDGIATDAFNLWSSAGNNGSIEPYGRTPVFKGGEQVFTITPNKDYQIAEVLVDGQSMTDNLVKPERYTAFLELTDIDSDHHIHATFDYAPEIFEDHEGRVIIYPNPANEMVNISSLDKINRIEVFNLSGQPIKVYEALSEKEISINTRVLRNGIYIMSIRTEKEVVSKKLQILR